MSLVEVDASFPFTGELNTLMFLLSRIRRKKSSYIQNVVAQTAAFTSELVEGGDSMDQR